MFLVNAPPVAAFQTQWTPFGLNATRRVSESLSQPTQTPDLPITTNLQGLIDIQENHASSRSVTVEYEHIMQWNSEGELKIDRGLKSRGTRFKGHTKEEATIIVPPQFKDIKGECSELGTLALDSDSDDSVDRGIEEAIQEYLKNRGSSSALSSNVVKCPIPGKSDTDKLKAVPKNAAVRKNPAKMVTSNTAAYTFTPQSLARCSSSDSTDSDDSFEQSINDEIEQFLMEKKRLQNSGKETVAAKNPVRNNTPVKPKLNVIKPAEKPSPKQGIKGLASGKPLSEMTRPRNPPKPKTEGSKANVCPKPVSESWKQPEQQAVPSGQQEELSDSSSDDGIEEAIQLYQLERSRLGGTLNATSAISSLKDSKATVIATPSFSHCLNKKSSPGSPKKTEYRKRKLSNSKASPSSQDSAGCQPLTSKRTFGSGDERNPPFGFPVQATLRAETAAELMCAEAILDISKAILPSKPESTLTMSQETSLSTQPVSSSSSSDSSVDSDDSIEQEIRTFLAHKALTESLGPATAKQPLSKKAKLKQSKPQPLSSNKPPKGKSHENLALKDLTGKGGELEKRSVNADTGVVVNASVTPNEDVLEKSTKVCMVERTNLQCRAEDRIAKAVESLESSPTLGVGKRKMYVKTRGVGSGDKSSSLDSDEDLDSAIKDLLRSKRKYKKRAKDGRPQCKKKVRFDETSAKPLETVVAGGFNHNNGNTKSPLVRSNLVNSNNPKETLKSKTVVKLKDEKQSIVGSAALPTGKAKPACASDKPVTSDSAFGDLQDSSSPVDSDDSTEQEIRKFLAERARVAAELAAARKPTVHPTVTDEAVAKAAAPPAAVKSPPPVKHEPRILSQSVTETILQKVRETARSAAPKQAVIQRVCAYKDGLSPVGQVRQPPVDSSQATAPVRSVIVKRGCVVDQNQIMRPTEGAPEAVLLQTDVNGAQGNMPVSGNFVAGLTYISGTEQQLLLSIAKSGATRVAAEMYNPVGAIAQLGSCPSVQKKTLILEQPHVVQAPAFSLGAPLVRPALYVVTTKVVQDSSGSFCLPMNTTAYDAGLNLMRIQYCHSQVASPTSTCTTPYSSQQNASTDAVGSSPGQAGEAQILTSRDVLESGSRACNVTDTATDGLQAAPCSNVTSESSVQRDKV